MSAPPLQLAEVSRRFRARIALDQVSLTVGPGEIVGLVGPNGSGKTTLLKIVAGFLRADSGTAEVFGLDPFLEPARVMERVRFAFAPPALFEALSPREHLRHLARLHGLAGREVEAQAQRALEQVGLDERADDRVGAFSFGMRQRLALAQALVPRPDLLVLDEPTDGLDPLAVLELRAVLQRLREEHGTAVLLSSHLLVEIESLVDRMLVLSEGRTLFTGEPSALTGSRAELRLVVDEPERARAALVARGIAFEERTACEFALVVDALSLEDAAALLRGAGARLVAYHVQRPTLEEVLLEQLRAQRGGPSAALRAGGPPR